MPPSSDSGNRQWLAVEVGLLRTEISDVDRLPGPDGAGNGEFPGQDGTQLRSAAYAAGNAPWSATCGIAPHPTTRSGQIVLGSRHRARRNGADGDGAQQPIELALDALHGAHADVMLGGELTDAGAALPQGVPDFALDGDRD